MQPCGSVENKWEEHADWPVALQERCSQEVTRCVATTHTHTQSKNMTPKKGICRAVIAAKRAMVPVNC